MFRSDSDWYFSKSYIKLVFCILCSITWSCHCCWLR